ncbi:MAG: radical SAM protein, partial [Spirochaetes bacterium]|nr:radical SAM protein [Spirochaetota bacterium]
IVIELTNRCNLNCPYCLVGMQNEQESVAHSALNRDFGSMDMSLTEKVIKDAKDFGMREVMLTFQGEPLLHKNFIDFVKLVKKQGMRAIVFSNGMLLNPEFSRGIIKAGLDSIQFSVDGASEKTYQLNRVGGRFEKVYQNMKDLVHIANEEKSSIRIAWQFIALRNNEHEIPLAQKLAEEIGVEFIVKSFAESIQKLAPRNPKYRRKLQLKPCTDIYRMLCVYWNGDIVPCCYDISGKEIFGNIKDSTIKEIWSSEKYVDFRKHVGEVETYPELDPQLCRTCLKWTLKEQE